VPKKIPGIKKKNEKDGGRDVGVPDVGRHKIERPGPELPVLTFTPDKNVHGKKSPENRAHVHTAITILKEKKTT